ncbi:unnamed protein product, partial [Brassica rapa subsp. trilocularis]
DLPLATNLDLWRVGLPSASTLFLYSHMERTILVSFGRGIGEIEVESKEVTCFSFRVPSLLLVVIW